MKEYTAHDIPMAVDIAVITSLLSVGLGLIYLGRRLSRSGEDTTHAA